MTLEQKVEIIRKNQAGSSIRQLASEYSVARPSIDLALKNKDKILAAYQQNTDSSAKRRRVEKFGEVGIGEKVWAWFVETRGKIINVTGEMIQTKAKELAEEYEVPAESFTASNGWLEKWKKRYNVKKKKICGESNELDLDIVADWVNKAQDILTEHAGKVILNADETGLFFRALPDTTLACKGDKAKGGKIAKER